MTTFGKAKISEVFTSPNLLTIDEDDFIYWELDWRQTFYMLMSYNYEVNLTRNESHFSNRILEITANYRKFPILMSNLFISLSRCGLGSKDCSPAVKELEKANLKAIW